MTEIILAIIGSGIITKLIDVCIDYFKNKKNPMVDGIRLCLLKDLTDYGHELTAQGHVTDRQLKAFNEGFETYKALKGDGYADKLKKEVDNLPLKV